MEISPHAFELSSIFQCPTVFGFIWNNQSYWLPSFGNLHVYVKDAWDFAIWWYLKLIYLILWFKLNIINLKVYLLWCENCTLLNSRNKILTVICILSFYMKVYQINRDDLVPTFYINATFNGGSCLSFLQSIIFQFYLYHVQSLDHL